MSERHELTDEDCPDSKMDDGSHSVLFYDGERCDWCGAAG